MLFRSVRVLRDGKAASAPAIKEGERLYFTWTLDGERRVVRLVADDASLEVLKKEELDRIDARVARDGVTGYVEAVDGDAVQFLVFSSGWFQANQWKPGQLVGLRATDASFVPTGDSIQAEVLARKNLGTYGSGANEVSLRLKNVADAKRLSTWTRGQVVSATLR